MRVHWIRIKIRVMTDVNRTATLEIHHCLVTEFSVVLISENRSSQPPSEPLVHRLLVSRGDIKHCAIK